MEVAPSQPDDARAWLTLHRVAGLGPRTLCSLLRHLGEPDAVLGAPAARLRELGVPARVVSGLRRPDRAGVDADLAWLRDGPRGLLTLACPDYPAPLLASPGPPPLLFLEGDRAALGSRGIAVVGSRQPSATGLALARRFAAELAGAGLAVISGLAAGIDGAAHAGALAGRGATLAVTGNGLDRVYPARHRALAREIAAHGLLLSEFPPGTPPARGHFPRRNRVIAGLAQGVLVVEAAPRSGSLITARLAAEAGREVFAVPGSVLNPLARGCHQLIRDGAKLVETVDDLLEEFPGWARAAGSVASGGDGGAAGSATEEMLLQCLRAGPASVDALVAASGLAAGEVAARLLALELGGHVSSDLSGRYCLRPGGRT